VYCGKTADWIRFPFGMVSRIGRGMGVLDGDGNRGRERGSFGGESGRSIVTNGDFVAYFCESDALFPNYFGMTCYCLFCCFVRIRINK